MLVTDPFAPDLWANLGILLAAAVAALAGYFGPKIFGRTPASSPSPTSPVITGVGLELGNREQTERLITAVNGVAAAIRDKKQDEMQETMSDLLEELKRQGR